jgi:hypothetical protein
MTAGPDEHDDRDDHDAFMRSIVVVAVFVIEPTLAKTGVARSRALTTAWTSVPASRSPP